MQSTGLSLGRQSYDVAQSSLFCPIKLYLNWFEQEEVGAVAATQWTHQGDVLALAVTAGEVITTGVIENTTDREETVFTGQMLVKKEDSQVTKHREVDRIFQSRQDIIIYRYDHLTKGEINKFWHPTMQFHTFSLFF